MEIEKTLNLVKGLMKGYVLKTTYGFLLKLDENLEPWINRVGCWQGSVYDVDIKFLEEQAQALPEKEYNNLIEFITGETNLII